MRRMLGFLTGILVAIGITVMAAESTLVNFGSPATLPISLTTGVSGTLPAGNGGLGFTTVTDDTMAIANGSLWQSKAIPNCTDTGGNHLNYTASTNTISCGTSGGGGSSTSGTFTATFTDACTTSPTVDFQWYKNGNLVSLRTTASSGFNCTSDSTSFSTAAGDLPSTIRPTAIASGGLFLNINQLAVTDNGTAFNGCVFLLDDGTIQIRKIATTTGASCGGWTNSGTKGWTVNNAFQILYVIEQ